MHVYAWKHKDSWDSCHKYCCPASFHNTYIHLGIEFCKFLNHWKELACKNHSFGNQATLVMLYVIHKNKSTLNSCFQESGYIGHAVCVWSTKKNCLIRLICLGIRLYWSRYIFWNSKKNWLIILIHTGIRLHLSHCTWFTEKSNLFVNQVTLVIL